MEGERQGQRPRKEKTNRPRNETSNRSPNKSRSGPTTTSSSSDGKPKPKPKPKNKKKPTSVEDALEAKVRAKQNREKKNNSSKSAAEDAVEAKIRKKMRNKMEAASARAESRQRPVDREEEKIEEGLSDDYSDDDGYSNSRSKKSANINSGISIQTSSQPPPPAATDADGNALFTRGGGDVRNRPPPSQNQQQALDPLREAQTTKEKNKKKVNPKFADFHETGQWGGLSNWEKYGICLLILGAIVAAIVFWFQFGRSNVEDTPPPTKYPTSSPSVSPSASPTGAPTDTTYRETFGLGLMTNASPKLTLPKDPEELKGAKNNVDSTPQELAAEFVLYDDPMNLNARDPRFMERYALVVFYYQNGGCAGDWITRTKWLEVPPPEDSDGDDSEAGSSSSSSSSADHCGWYGIVCDLKKRVIEVNLSKNYVTGEIPMEFGQLLQLSTLDLSNNALVGEVPAVALSMKNMFTIQLNNNMLEGEFPFEEVKKGAYILDNLWIQENTELNGAITEAYCELNSITLDCDNFDPQPTYPVEDNGGLTTFEINCPMENPRSPKEYTCNFDDPVPFTKSPAVAGATNVPATSPATVCGTPAVNRR